MAKVEEGKKYWITFDDDFRCLILPIINRHNITNPKTVNFRYTHYFNYIGFNLNQFSIDYINDCIKFDDPVCVCRIDDITTYSKVKSIVEIIDGNQNEKT
jgi:hypothetical protein